MRNRIVLGALPALFALGCASDGSDATRALAQLGKGPALGRPVSAADVAALDIVIAPSGAGLPAGSGNARAGAQVYAAKCRTCHGEKGGGKPADPLVGGKGTLASDNPIRTVGSYWPHATTLFDYTRRAMPVTAPRSLTNDEVYAVVAYILHLNGIIAEDHTLDAQTLPAVRMPNREGFVDHSKIR